MEKRNPHAMSAGASDVAGYNPIASITPLPLNSIAKGVPPAALLRILSGHSREELAAFITIAIDLLDMADGDPDAENACDLEDDFTLSSFAYVLPGPGCTVSDPGGRCDEDEINTYNGNAQCFLHGMSWDGPGCPIAEGTV